ncbi:MAG: hypothetical protein K2L55_01705 [Muribaculaceae bacterium]|nr:hypothetical protein [Muribaculaceae bacterium]
MNSADCLKYKDDADRSYGVAGMALAAFILDYEKYISSVSVERRGLDSVDFTPDFYIAAGESISAKASWAHVLEQYQVIASMLISNVMCRRMVKDRTEPDMSLRSAMLDALSDYAVECQLESDEAAELFDKHYLYFDRAYRNSRLHAAAKRLADELSSKHTLSHSELCELLGGF